jgi:Fe-S-cluster-containing hydrogenase component 2
MACSFEKAKEFNPVKSRVKIMKNEEQGIDYPVICEHCEDPPCMMVCPVEAISRDPKTDAVILNEDTCVGCRACMIACPYGAISIDITRRKIIKCDLCNGDPKCAKWCEPGAIQFVRADRADIAKKRGMMEKMSAAILESRKAAAASR